MSYYVSVMFAVNILISLIILHVCVQGRAPYAEKVSIWDPVPEFFFQALIGMSY